MARLADRHGLAVLAKAALTMRLTTATTAPRMSISAVPALQGTALLGDYSSAEHLGLKVSPCRAGPETTGATFKHGQLVARGLCGTPRRWPLLPLCEHDVGASSRLPSQSKEALL